MTKEINYLWPVHVARKTYPHHEETKQALLDFTTTYMEQNANSRQGDENVNLFESGYNIFKDYHDKNEAVGKLAKFLAFSMGEVAQLANKQVWEEKGITAGDVMINLRESWFINYLSSGNVFPHTHGGSWSCVYYLQMDDPISKTDGCTYFISPSLRVDDTYDIGNCYAAKPTVMSAAKEGDCLFFPAHILHGSYPHLGNKNRIIFSANASFDKRK